MSGRSGSKGFIQFDKRFDRSRQNFQTKKEDNTHHLKQKEPQILSRSLDNKHCIY